MSINVPAVEYAKMKERCVGLIKGRKDRSSFWTEWPNMIRLLLLSFLRWNMARNVQTVQQLRCNVLSSQSGTVNAVQI